MSFLQIGTFKNHLPKKKIEKLFAGQHKIVSCHRRDLQAWNIRKLKRNTRSAFFCCSVFAVVLHSPTKNGQMDFPRFLPKTSIFTGFHGFSVERHFSPIIHWNRYTSKIVYYLIDSIYILSLLLQDKSVSREGKCPLWELTVEGRNSLDKIIKSVKITKILT